MLNPRILLVSFFVSAILLTGNPADATTIKRNILFKISRIQHTHDSEPNTYENLSKGGSGEFLWQYDASENSHEYPYKYIWSLNDTFLLSFEYEDDRSEGDEHEGDEHEGDEHEGDEHEDDEHEDDEHEDDELLTRADIKFSHFEMGTGFDEINEALEANPAFNPEYWLREAGGSNIRIESLKRWILPSSTGYKGISLQGNYYTGDWDGTIRFYDCNFKTVTLGVESTVVPEPSTWILLGNGLAGLAWFARRRKQK